MINIDFRYGRFIEASVAILLIIYPSMMFAVKGGMNGSFLLLLLLSIAVLVFRPSEMKSVEWNREMKSYLLAMAALPVAIFLSQIYHQNFTAHPYDAVSRFLLAVPIFMLLRRVRFEVVALVQYSFSVGAIVGLLMSKNQYGRLGTPLMDVIHFGNFELILGVLSVLSINWTGRDAFLLRCFKIVGFLVGVYASIASGSRGGWIAVPVFLLIFIYFRLGRISAKVIIAIPFLIALTGFFAYVSSQEIHHRVDDMVNDLIVFRHGNPDTSTGIRLQIFQTAAEIILQNPIFGVGPEGFAHEMESMSQAGKITPLAAELGKAEVHNELLSKAAGLGIFGLIAMLSVYLMPLRIFYNATRSALVPNRQAGLLGFTFVGGFIVFGLTAETLNLTMATAFYGLTVAVLLAACLSIHHSEQITQR